MMHASRAQRLAPTIAQAHRVPGRRLHVSYAGCHLSQGIPFLPVQAAGVCLAFCAKEDPLRYMATLVGYAVHNALQRSDQRTKADSESQPA